MRAYHDGYFSSRLHGTSTRVERMSTQSRPTNRAWEGGLGLPLVTNL